MTTATKTANPSPGPTRGLEGVIALESALSLVDGQAGRLVYRGYSIEDLAENATFEEVAHLLWRGKLPNRSELDQLNAELTAEREIPAGVYDLLRSTPAEANPSAVLRTAVSQLGPIRCRGRVRLA